MGEGAPEGVKGGKYGVKLVRGPFVQLPPHPEECEEEDFLAYAARLRADGAAWRRTCSAGPAG